MAVGFVYVMFNPAMPGLVKVGLTRHSSVTRARQLRGTGVPDEFIVAYDELVTDCALVEARLHQRFHEFRYSANREFFRVPLRDAVRGLVEEAWSFLVPRVGAGEGAEMLPALKRIYPSYLRSDFHSVKIVHIGNVVYLETARPRCPDLPGLRDEIVERTDLHFIWDDDAPSFASSMSPADNAAIFLQSMDPYSIIQCTDLFTPEACDVIANEIESGRF